MAWLDLESEVLEEFACSGSPTRNVRFHEDAAWVADLGEREEAAKEAEREWHRRNRARDRLTRKLRKQRRPRVHWRECPFCGMSFAVIERPWAGRRRLFCTEAHREAAASAAYRDRTT